MNAIARIATSAVPRRERFPNLMKNVAFDDAKTVVTSKMFVNAAGDMTGNFKTPMTADQAKGLLALLGPRVGTLNEREDLAGTIGNQLFASAGPKMYSPGARTVLLAFIKAADAEQAKINASQPQLPPDAFSGWDG